MFQSFLRWLILWFGLLVAPTMTFAQACTVPPDLLNVHSSLCGISLGGGEVTADQSAGLDRAVAPISRSAVMARLGEQGLADLVPTATALLDQAHSITRSGRVSSPAALTILLDDFTQTIDSACAASQLTVFQSLQKASLGGVLVDDNVNWSEVEKLINTNEAAIIGLLVMLLALVIVAIYLLDATIRWALAFVYNRKACRIPTVLHSGGTEVAGQILTLGRGGCRFTPDDQEAFDVALKTIRHSACDFACRDVKLPSNLSTLHDVVADFRFVAPISLRLQRQILEQSTIPPYFVKKARKDERNPEQEAEPPLRPPAAPGGNAV